MGCLEVDCMHLVLQTEVAVAAAHIGVGDILASRVVEVMQKVWEEVVALRTGSEKWLRR